jgi:hypothetical protein
LIYALPGTAFPLVGLGPTSGKAYAIDEQGLLGNVFGFYQVRQVHPVVELGYDLIEAHGSRETATVSFSRHFLELVPKGLFEWVALHFL